MAIIYSYPLNDNIGSSDELVGTTEKSINGQLKTVTRNFLLGDLSTFFIEKGGIQKTIILTTAGSNGPATLNTLTGELNIPQYIGITNLGYIASALNGIVTSSTGLDATIPLANSTIAGLLNPANFIVLSNTSGINTGDQNLQQVTNLGTTTTNPITANSFIRIDGTGDNVLLDNGNTVALSSIGGNQNLQEVTDIEATTTNGITITVGDGGGNGISSTSSQGYGVYGSSSENYGVYGTSTSQAGVYGISDNYGVHGSSANIGVYGEGYYGIYGNTSNGAAVYGTSDNGIGIFGYSEYNVGISAYSNSIGLEVNGNGTIAIEANLGNSNKGIVINSGTSSTGNPIVVNKNGVDKLVVNQEGELTATKLIKEGGTSAQLLAANGDTITAGTNITISGGTISSTGGAGGSSSVNFYLNGSIASNVVGYQQIGTTAVIGIGTDFSLIGNGTIAQFLTDVGSPNRLEIPSGAWNFELWLQSSVNNSGTNVHIELYKYDGAFTLIATGVSNSISLQTNTTTNLYVTNIAIPQTTLLVTDRLAVRVIATNSIGTHGVTLHTEDSNLCEVLTNFVGGVTAINGITQPSQTLVAGTAGTDFDIQSSGSTHTFNLPSASATARGAVTTTTQTFAGAKTFSNSITAGANIIGTNTPDISNTSYNIIIRNASTGVFEKLGATTIQPLIYNILIASTIGITTQTLGTNGGLEYSQDGRNVMINNGTTPIQVTATNASSSFIASYTKLGTGIITFASSPTLIAPYGTELNGNPGSTALLTKNGTTVYLLVNNLL